YGTGRARVARVPRLRVRAPPSMLASHLRLPTDFESPDEQGSPALAERKSARLIELLTLVLTRRYGVELGEIRRLRGYPRGEEAFHRQFERDKELLRELGFAVVARGEH